jgi:peptidoglycan/xylan/chitin deacetylase (PgdA/CDA1 family)
MPLNLFLTFDVESNRPGNYITCEHVPGAPGLFWIMDELERHGFRGVLFVNVYEHTRYSDGWMRDILRQIHDRGHEVGLHCHANPELDFYRQNLTLYDLAGQTRIIRYGVDYIEAATGNRPVSFRSGALRVNDDTFRALESCQLRIDSSLIFSSNDGNNNDVSTYRSINKAAWYDGVREFPITLLTRCRRDRPTRAARLDPNVTPDAQGLIAAVEQMIAAGCHHAVLIGHSFSFLLCTYDQTAGLPGLPVFKKDKQKFVMGVDHAAKATFVEFLDFLESRRATVQPLLFRDLPRSDRALTAGPDFVPQVPDNGLPAWPTAEDYEKKASGTARSRSYRHRPKDVLLHVGTWKTGSKALQKFWARNQDELRRRGIFYPLNLNAPYMQGGNRSYQSLIATAGDPMRRRRLLALAEEIHAQACETALVSHENICNLELPELFEFVACLSGCRFKIVLYLRRQDHYAASLYNQHVKAGVAFSGSFDEHFEHYRSRYDYRQMVERLGSVFGLENVVVRPYEQEAFFEGTIFADFCHHVLGMAIDESFVMPKRDQNARLDLDALEFKRIVNGMEGTRQEVLSLGKYLIGYSETRDPSIREAFQEHMLLSPGQRSRILRACAQGNAWVAREMLAREDGTLFYEPMPSEDASWSEYRGLSGEKAIEIAFHVYRRMLRELERRDAEIERLKDARRAASPRPQSGRDTASWARVVKRFCKRQFPQGKSFVSRIRSGIRPRPGLPK